MWLIIAQQWSLNKIMLYCLESFCYPAIIFESLKTNVYVYSMQNRCNWFLTMISKALSNGHCLYCWMQTVLNNLLKEYCKVEIAPLLESEFLIKLSTTIHNLNFSAQHKAGGIITQNFFVCSIGTNFPMPFLLYIRFRFAFMLCRIFHNF